MNFSRLRTLLVLGRVSNLPTVWSNCLAAWVLSGGGEWKKFALVLASGSSLYLGGMFLNDACDAEFDRRQRQDRPIPKGSISPGEVWAWGLALLLAGVLLAIPLGGRALGCALALLAAIVAYDLWHKRHPFTVGLMAGCRALLYLLAGIAAAGTISNHLMEAAAGLAAYILGISLLARHESSTNRPPKWPMLLLAMPVVPAALHASSDTFAATAIAVVLFAVWLAVALGPLRSAKPQTGRAVGRLLAGIVLADGLQIFSIAPSWTYAMLLAVLLGFMLWLQRRIPST